MVNATGEGSPPDQRVAGLFIGIGKYNYQAGVKPLAFAPDDAVALAHLFVVERSWVRPEDAKLALSGEPKSARGRERLRELQRLGVREVTASRAGLERALTQLGGRRAGDKPSAGPLILAFSGHGHEGDGVLHLLPADSDWAAIGSTSLSSSSILLRMRGREHSPKLWLLDTCTTKLDVAPQERASARSSFDGTLQRVPSLTVLASCRSGEKSYQSDDLEQGVYTHFLLQAIRSTAPANAPYASLNWLKISDQAAETTRQWLAARNCFDQHPWHFSTAQPAPAPAAQ